MAGLWFSPGSPVSSTNKTDRHDMTEILLKVAFSTISSPPPPKQTFKGQIVWVKVYRWMKNLTNLINRPVPHRPWCVAGLEPTSCEQKSATFVLLGHQVFGIQFSWQKMIMVKIVENFPVYEKFMVVVLVLQYWVRIMTFIQRMHFIYL